MIAAVMTISANAESTTAHDGTKVRNEIKMTIAIPINARIMAINACVCRVFPNDSPIWSIFELGYLCSMSEESDAYFASSIVPNLINFPLLTPSPISING